MNDNDRYASREEVAFHFANALLREYGEDALTMAERQLDAADDTFRATWTAIIDRLSGLSIRFDRPVTVELLRRSL